MSLQFISQKTLNIQKEFDHLSNILSRTKRLKQLDFKRGFSGSLRTSQRFFKRKYESINTETDLKFNNSSNIIWIDNYSKFYKLATKVFLSVFIIDS